MRISANGAFAHVEYVFAAIKGYKKNSFDIFLF